MVSVMSLAEMGIWLEGDGQEGGQEGELNGDDDVTL